MDSSSETSTLSFIQVLSPWPLPFGILSQLAVSLLSYGVLDPALITVPIDLLSAATLASWEELWNCQEITHTIWFVAVEQGTYITLLMWGARGARLWRSLERQPERRNHEWGWSFVRASLQQSTVVVVVEEEEAARSLASPVVVGGSQSAGDAGKPNGLLHLLLLGHEGTSTLDWMLPIFRSKVI